MKPKLNQRRITTLIIQGRARLARIDIRHVVETVLEDYLIRKATRFISPKLVVRAVRQHKPRRDDIRTTLVLTFGKPNFREREFIRACIKAKEPFPVKKMQVKWYPK